MLLMVNPSASVDEPSVSGYWHACLILYISLRVEAPPILQIIILLLLLTIAIRSPVQVPSKKDIESFSTARETISDFDSWKKSDVLECRHKIDESLTLLHVHRILIIKSQEVQNDNPHAAHCCKDHSHGRNRVLVTPLQARKTGLF